MATITSTPSVSPSSISINGTSTKTATISWSAPSVPSGSTISSCVLTGATDISMKKGSATVTINGTTIYSSSFDINLGTSNSTTSVSIEARGGNKNANGTVSFSNLVYTVTYEEPIASSYTVTFKDWDGTVLKTEIVDRGASATAPPKPSREGYAFVGWDKNFTNIRSNLIVTAKYNEIIGTIPDGITPIVLGYENIDGLESIYPGSYNVDTFTATLGIIDGKYICAYADNLTIVDGIFDNTLFFSFDLSAYSNIQSAELSIVSKSLGSEEGQMETTLMLGSGANGFSQSINTENTTFTTTTYDVTNAVASSAGSSVYGSVNYYYLDVDAALATRVIQYVPAVAIDCMSLKVVEGPPVFYQVQFVDSDGIVLSTQNIESGKAATAPPDPVKSGYIFIGWDTDFTNVRSDLTVTAQYREISTDYFELNASTLYLATADTVQLSISTNLTDAITWNTNNQKIASVVNGLITAGNSSGTCTITATCGTYSKSCTINVVNSIAVPTTHVSIEPDVFHTEVGNTKQLAIDIVPNNATYLGVNWSSSNSNVAAIDSTGLVTANSAGEATITAMTNDGQARAVSVAIVANKIYIESITINSNTLDLNLDERCTIEYSYLPNDAINDVIIASSNSSIIEVQNGNVLRAVRAGNCTVDVFSRHNQSIKQTINITVNNSRVMLSFAPNGDMYVKGTTDTYLDNLAKFNLNSVAEDSNSVYIDTTGKLHGKELIISESIDDSVRLATQKSGLIEAINANGIDNNNIANGTYSEISTVLNDTITKYKSAFDVIDTIEVSPTATAADVNKVISYMPVSEIVTETVEVKGLYATINMPCIQCLQGCNVRAVATTTGDQIGRLVTGDVAEIKGRSSGTTGWYYVYNYRLGSTTTEAEGNEFGRQATHGYVSSSATYITETVVPTETLIKWKAVNQESNITIRKYPGISSESLGTLASGVEVYILDDCETYSGAVEGGAIYQWYHIYVPSKDWVGYFIVQNIGNTLTAVEGDTVRDVLVPDKTLDLTKANLGLSEINKLEALEQGWSVITSSDNLQDFTGGPQFLDVAMTYFSNRNEYLTYSWTNVMTSSGTKTWNDVTTAGADSPDGLYRHIDCSGLVGLAIRGIPFSEVYANQTTYENKSLAPRTSTYSWATEFPRTAAEQCKYCDENCWCLDEKDWRLSSTELDFSKLNVGDLIFYGGQDNGRYLGVYHVAIYYGLNSNNLPCVLEATSSSYVASHTDGITKAVTIITFVKKNQTDRICRIARPQLG